MRRAQEDRREALEEVKQDDDKVGTRGRENGTVREGDGNRKEG